MLILGQTVCRWMPQVPNEAYLSPTGLPQSTIITIKVTSYLISSRPVKEKPSI